MLKQDPLTSFSWLIFRIISVSVIWGTYSRQALYKRQEDVYLSNHVIQIRSVDGEFECGIYCSGYESCLSVNYRSATVGGELDMCELNNATIQTSAPDDVLETSGFTYLGVVLQMHKKGLQPGPAPNTDSPPTSCKDAFTNNKAKVNGENKLQMNNLSEVFPVYCHMSELGRCGGGGWTLVMKINGAKETFKFESAFWIDKSSHQVSQGLRGLREEETKLASYWNTPFTRICLGMTSNKVTHWTVLNYTARSLFDVIAGSSYKATSLGRPGWKSLITKSSLQKKCNKEGFNLKYGNRIRMRLGFVGNNEDDCSNPDSWIGFGSQATVRGRKSTIRCGNVGCIYGDNGNKAVVAFGYIFVQ